MKFSEVIYWYPCWDSNYLYENRSMYHVWPLYAAKKAGYDVEFLTVSQYRLNVRSPFPMKMFRCIPKKFYSPGLFKSLMGSDSDIFYLHSYGSMAFEVAPLLKHFRQKKVIVVPHWLPSSKSGGLRGLYDRQVGRRIMNNVDRVIIFTDWERDLLMDLGVQKERLELIPHVIDHTFFSKSSERPFVSKYGLEGKKVVLSVGTISPQKGTDTFVKTAVEVLKQRDDVVFVNVGATTNPEYANKSKALIPEEFRKKIIFSGWLSKEMLDSAYMSADIFFFPTRYECFGLVIGEAMAAETPVVSSNNTAVPYVVPENTGYLHDSEDVDSFKDDILKLLDDGSLRERLGKAGRRHVKSNFDINVVSKRFLKMLEQVRE